MSLEIHAAPQPDPPTVGGIREQFALYWGGRRFWLCLFGVAGCDGWFLLSPAVGLFSPAFLSACALSCWIPAWAASDLLSVGVSDNPFPHREWRPRELLQRAWIRLLPPFLCLVVWCGTFVARSLHEELGYTSPMILIIEKKEDFLAVACSWTTVFLASGMAYAAGTALCSSLFRRPRRWLVTPAVVVAGSVMIAWMVEWLAAPYLPSGGWMRSNLTQPASAVSAFVEAPNYLVGSGVAMGVTGWLDRHEAVAAGLCRGMPPGISLYCWIATVFFVGGTLLLTLATGWVARRRYLRHPYTGDRGMITGSAPPDPSQRAPQE